MKNRIVTISFSILLSSLISGCGGGSSDEGMLIHGTLTEAGGAHHESLLRHGDGARIGNVEICALGECSLTDDEGQWGFTAAPEFKGGQVAFEIEGHGISTMSVFEIPLNAREVTLDLAHVEGGVIEATEITVDGVVEDAGDDIHEPGHDDHGDEGHVHE